MKLKLTDLDPHLLKRVAPLDYEFTDDIGEAEGLQLQCPACHLGGADYRGRFGHTVVLLRDGAPWHFVGCGCGDLSLVAGPQSVAFTAGPCRAQFYIRDGRVDFSA